MDPAPLQPQKPSWRRKTVEERRRDERAPEHQRFHVSHLPWMGLAVVLVVGAFVVLIAVASLDRERSMVAGAVAAALVVASIAGAGFVMSVYTDPEPPRIGICDRCFKLTLVGTLDHCECGGTFEDINGWTPNQCPRCGYDLRATVDWCPECGHRLADAYVVPRDVPLKPRPAASAPEGAAAPSHGD